MFLFNRSTIFGIAILFVLTACGGGGGGGGSTSSGSYFLLAGNSGDQWYASTPGNWTKVLGMTSAYNARGVAFGNGKYVWVGDCGVGCYASSSTSSTLDNPLFTRTDFGDFTIVHEVTFGNGVFVAIGNHSTLGAQSWVSSDGVNWTMNSIVGYSSISGIAFGNGVFVATCGASTAPFQYDICYSTDGSWCCVGADGHDPTSSRLRGGG